MMLPLQYARRWRLASAVLLTAVLAAALMPAVWFFSDAQGSLAWFGHFDKIVHVLTFLVLALWFTGLYETGAYWRILLGLLLFGIFIEVCQAFVGYRSAEWADAAADLLGVFAGLGLGAAGAGGWCLRLEEQLARH